MDFLVCWINLIALRRAKTVLSFDHSKCKRVKKLNDVVKYPLMVLSSGTAKNNKFSICSKWKIYYFKVSQNWGKLQPNHNVL